MSWFSSGVHVAFAQVARPERYSRDAAVWPALKAGGREDMIAAYAELEARLSDERPWLLGTEFSLVDPYAYVFFRWAGRWTSTWRTTLPSPRMRGGFSSARRFSAHWLTKPRPEPCCPADRRTRGAHLANSDDPPAGRFAGPVSPPSSGGGVARRIR